MKGESALELLQEFFYQFEIYFRILISAILGFIIGWDRSLKNKPAGVKTYTFVSVACTLITLVSMYSAEMYVDYSDTFRVDPMRLAAQIVSGLGFLGAGVILKNNMQVQGLTSAAMIFFVGGVGIGIGAGFYSVVIFAVFTCLIIVKIGNMLEKSNRFFGSDTDNDLNV